MYQHGLLAGATFFALHQLLAAEWDILLELRLKLRRDCLFRADSGRKPLGIPFRLLLIGPWLLRLPFQTLPWSGLSPVGIELEPTWIRVT